MNKCFGLNRKISLSFDSQETTSIPKRQQANGALF